MTLVLDAEPAIAYVLDETGAETVENVFEKIRSGTISGLMCAATAAEVHYVVAREATESKADEFLGFVRNIGIDYYTVAEILSAASRFKREYGVALGDAFALGTAAENGATLLVGADDDYDPIEADPEEPEIRRFRTTPG